MGFGGGRHGFVDLKLPEPGRSLQVPSPTGRLVSSMPRGRTVPTMAELERAIYVDFEGNKDRHPTLLGMMTDGEVDLVIVEEVFKDCADRRGSPCRFARLDSSLRSLIEVAQKEDRRIISWSEHDFGLKAEQLDAEHQSLLDTRYVNAIFAAKTWRALKRPDVSGSNTLSRYMSLLGWKVPENIGTGTVGPALSTIRGSLNQGTGAWAELTPHQRQLWKGVLRHNRHDLSGMSRVLLRAVGDIWRWLGRL